MNEAIKALEALPLRGRLLPAYTGPCSIGVVTHPRNAAEVAVEVRLPVDSTVQVASCLEVDGHKIDVLVRHDYRPIQALAAH